MVETLTLFIEQADSTPPWGGYNFDKPSRAVIAAGENGSGVVLWTVGGHVRMEMEEVGLTALDDLGLEPETAGIFVWEGRYVWSPGPYEYPMDGEMSPDGIFREPTPEEWVAIRSGQCPWEDEDWMMPAAKELE